MHNPFEKFRRWCLRRGYGCDCCGKELFDYPTHRLCEACEEKLLVPKLPCPKCGRERVADGICSSCKKELPEFTAGCSAFVYKDEAARLVNRMKNGNERLCAYLGEKMGERFFERFGGEWGAPLLLVPVPTTKERRRERGFNQAERLAESIADALAEREVETELRVDVLTKTRETKPQKRMSKSERAENVKGAFSVKDRASVRGRIVLLVDDVTTTSATGNECARRLFSAGATAVYFLTATAVMEEK